MTTPDAPSPESGQPVAPLPKITQASPETTNTWVKADHLERANRVWAARVAGHTWREAAEIGGYASPENAIRAVRNVYGHVPRLDREELRNLWRDRLESTWRQAGDDMSEQRPGAVTAAV